MSEQYRNRNSSYASVLYGLNSFGLGSAIIVGGGDMSEAGRLALGMSRPGAGSGLLVVVVVVVLTGAAGATRSGLRLRSKTLV